MSDEKWSGVEALKVIHRYGNLHAGILLKRYKRFLADIRLDDGREITAFTPNSGSMKTCSVSGSPVMLSHDPKPGRKTEFTLEMVQSGNTWVGVNTILANTLGARIVDAGLLGQSASEGFSVLRREVVLEDSRLDLFAGDGKRTCYIEVKNVTYRKDHTALFPDAVTTRGKKHLETLIRASGKGIMACNLFIVQRSDCCDFAPAHDIDPEYADVFHRGVRAGVLMLPCQLHLEPDGIIFKQFLPLAGSW